MNMSIILQNVDTVILCFRLVSNCLELLVSVLNQVSNPVYMQYVLSNCKIITFIFKTRTISSYFTRVIEFKAVRNKLDYFVDYNVSIFLTGVTRL
jgi:hypothetical protein